VSFIIPYGGLTQRQMTWAEQSLCPASGAS